MLRGTHCIALPASWPPGLGAQKFPTIKHYAATPKFFIGRFLHPCRTIANLVVVVHRRNLAFSYEDGVRCWKPAAPRIPRISPAMCDSAQSPAGQSLRWCLTACRRILSGHRCPAHGQCLLWQAERRVNCRGAAFGNGPLHLPYPSPFGAAMALKQRLTMPATGQMSPARRANVSIPRAAISHRRDASRHTVDVRP